MTESSIRVRLMIPIINDSKERVLLENVAHSQRT